MVRAGVPLRGEVWVCAFPPHIGPHPAVVLTENSIAQPLSAITVAVITGSEGPARTHVPVGPESGLKKYDQSYVNCADLHTVRKTHVRRRLGLVGLGELNNIEFALCVVLGLS